MELIEAKELALSLMREHDLVGWGFDFNNRKRSLGICSPKKKLIFLSRSYVIMNGENRVKNTILHEIAHALVPQEKHGWRWRAKFIALGGDGKARTSQKDVTLPISKYDLICPICGTSTTRFRRTNISYSCKRCIRVGHDRAECVVVHRCDMKSEEVKRND